MMKKKWLAYCLSLALAVTSLTMPAAGAEFTSVPESADAAAEMPAEAASDPTAVSGNGTSGESFSALSTGEVFSGLSTAAVSASASSASITCRGHSSGKVRITAKVGSPVKSTDDYYYLFLVNPNTNKLTTRVARAKKPSGKNKSVSFTLDTSGHPEYVVSKFALAVKSKAANKLSSYTRISGGAYVQNPEKAAVYTTAYKLPKTKKGLQTTNISELSETKSKTAFFNLPVSVVLANNAERVTYTYNGKKYNFNMIGGYTSLVRQCNAKGIQVTMQILLDWTPATKSLAAASSPGSRSAYYAWNTTDAASRQKMEALFSFLSELFGSDDCYVSNWILGNEVNTCSRWNYAGNISQSKYVSIYSEAFRCLYNAVRGYRASSRVFICLDQYWNNTWEDYSGKSVLNAFHSCLKNLQKGVNWNLAYHAYPYPLTDAAFWSGKYSSNLTNNSNSPVINLSNLSVLTNYIKKNFGSKTRVILSEQGFTSSRSQDIQAAAVALGYYIAACNPMVDAFIVRSYQDEAHEVAQGLAMGLKGKKAFRVFANMDSSKSLTYTSSYLKSQVGSNWSSKVPGYSAKRLYKLYRK